MQFLPFRGIERGIGEVQRVIRAENYVVRTVELLAVVLIREHLVRAVVRDLNDRAKHACRRDQPPLCVASAPVRIADTEAAFYTPVGITPRELILRHVAHRNESPRIPPRPLGESEAARDFLQL